MKKYMSKSSKKTNYSSDSDLFSLNFMQNLPTSPQPSVLAIRRASVFIFTVTGLFIVCLFVVCLSIIFLLGLPNLANNGQISNKLEGPIFEYGSLYMIVSSILMEWAPKTYGPFSLLGIKSLFKGTFLDPF